MRKKNKSLRALVNDSESSECCQRLKVRNTLTEEGLERNEIVDHPDIDDDVRQKSTKS